MTRRHGRFLIWFAVLICWAAPAGSRAQVLEQTFSDTLAGFKISTPNQEWNLEPRGTDPGEWKLTLRFQYALHQFTPNVTVKVIDSPGISGKTSDALDEAVAQLPKSWSVVEKKPITLRNAKGVELKLKETDTKLQFLQWFFHVKDKIFIVTCTAKEDSYPRVQDDFIKILHSFEII